MLLVGLGLLVSLFSDQAASAGGTVTTCNEASLRTAIQGGGTVTFACDGTITLANTIALTNSTTLDANGRNVTISGGNLVRVFTIDSGLTVTMIGLTLANGRTLGTNGVSGSDGESVCGGAILSRGNLSLFDCVVSNNAAIGGNGAANQSTFTAGAGGTASGGAACNFGGSVLVSNCLFTANRTIGGNGSTIVGPVPGRGGDARGGAFYSDGGSTTFVATRLTGNSITGGVGGARSSAYGPFGSSLGGALFAANGVLSINGSELSLNNAVAQSLAPLTVGDAGGACGGAAYFSNSTVHIKSTTFKTNISWAGAAFSGANAHAHAGGIYNLASLWVDESMFFGNVAVGGDGARDGGGQGKGGAIYNRGGLALNASTFVANKATGGTGIPSPPPSSGGNGSGGGIHNAGTLLATNVTLVSNIAIGGESMTFPPFGSGPGGNGLGGAIFQETNSAVVNHMTIVSNTVVGGRSVAGTPGTGFGGGLCSSNANLRLQNTLLAFNSPSNCFGTVVDDGNNISSDNSCPFTASGSLANTDPILGPLADFGGPTPTMALLAGSPAINHALSGFCAVTDQRGRSRPSGAACDVGAFESSPPFSVRGVVTRYLPAAGITVTAGASSATTTADGRYILLLSSAGNYSVVPSSPEIIAVPAVRNVSVVTDVLGVDFRAYRLNGFTFESYQQPVLHFVFAGTNTLAYEVQGSTDLNNWSPLSTNIVGADNLFDYYHTNQPPEDRHFFRALARPR